MLKRSVLLTFVLCSHALGMHQQPFNLSDVCYNESQNILQSRNKNPIINELKKIKASKYSISSLENIHITKSIYVIIRDYMLSNNIPLREIVLNNKSNDTICAYNLIEQQLSSLHGSWCYGAMKKVASELLVYLEIDSLGSQLQSTQLEDRMDEEK